MYSISIETNFHPELFYLLQTVLAIGVFGGLGIGALAYVDYINWRTNLCNKVSTYVLLQIVKIIPMDHFFANYIYFVDIWVLLCYR